MFQSVLFNLTFYVGTGAFLLLGSPLLLGPRKWSIEALKLHARVMMLLHKVIVGTQVEIRGREHIPQGAALIAAKHQSTWDTFGPAAAVV